MMLVYSENVFKLSTLFQEFMKKSYKNLKILIKKKQCDNSTILSVFPYPILRFHRSLRQFQNDAHGFYR